MRRSRSSFLFLAAAALVALALPLQAKAPWVKKAQDLGFKDVKSCTACHEAPMPKAADHGAPFKEMGTFLMQEKAKHKAAEVDLAWLKNYKPAAK